MDDVWPAAIIKNWQARHNLKAVTMQIFTPPALPYHQELLLVARESLNSGDKAELVVITAHMACEILTAQTLDVLIERKNLHFLAEWLDDRLPNSNLGNRTVRTLYEALSGEVISGVGPVVGFSAP